MHQDPNADRFAASMTTAIGMHHSSTTGSTVPQGYKCSGRGERASLERCDALSDPPVSSSASYVYVNAALIRPFNTEPCSVICTPLCRENKWRVMGCVSRKRNVQYVPGQSASSHPGTMNGQPDRKKPNPSLPNRSAFTPFFGSFHCPQRRLGAWW
jgi:hypothetical protein